MQQAYTKGQQMLNQFKKLLNVGKPAQQKEVSMTVEEGQLVAADNNTAELTALLATATQALADSQSKYVELATELATLQAAFKSAEGAQAALVADAKAKVLAARKEKIVAAVGTGKADALLTATESLEDAAFNAVVSAMAGSVDAEANTNLFKEVGVDAQADATQVTEADNETAKLLAAKYKTK